MKSNTQLISVSITLTLGLKTAWVLQPLAAQIMNLIVFVVIFVLIVSANAHGNDSVNQKTLRAVRAVNV